jgi:hypothetical protein
MYGEMKSLLPLTKWAPQSKVGVMLTLFVVSATLSACGQRQENVDVHDFYGTWIVQATRNSESEGANGPSTRPSNDLLTDRVLHISEGQYRDVVGSKETSGTFQVVKSRGRSVLIREHPEGMPDELKNADKQTLIDRLNLTNGTLPFHTGLKLTQDGRLRVYNLKVENGELTDKREFTPEVFVRKASATQSAGG